MHVVSREEMQAIDRYTIGQIGLGGPLLMENAGRAVYDELAPNLKKGEKICVVLGKGNNGGDGFVAARMLLDSGVDEEVWLLPDPLEIKGDAAYHMNAFLKAGGRIRTIQEEREAFSQSIGEADLVIDALLGTGFQGTPYPECLEVIDQMNQSKATVVSVDLPSGVPANGEFFSHHAVAADLTLTLECPKLAQFVQPAARCFGEVRTLSIGIPEVSVQQAGVRRKVWREEDVRCTLPHRDPFSHKGSHGKGLLIAGSEQMSGAAFFSARAALRSGIGLLSLSVPDEVRPTIASHLPETMFMPRSALDFQGLSGIAIGPGLGREPEQADLVRRVLEYDSVPCVIDADGIYYLSGMTELLRKRKSPIVLTPHPGEMAHLLGTSVSEVEKSRFDVSKQFAEKFGVYLVLKGRNTIITAPDGGQVVNTTGNAALAKGGSGDVLTGILFAFLLQHGRTLDAVCNAVYLHGALADDLVKTGHSQLDVLATDLIEHIPPVLHHLYQKATC
ncbi:NAD(P)H-hydrate dehydratase [Sporolactobacillus shoreae]|uniref:Bifunctional NAD(P)H-hydrate repair enzyme n=1 Tax=Sporolactobacillus shoreae TaxID=1465501 RepID=A0A4Z0GMW0_9BACL|nr:NAD(P)H-hydrate dehydratase [Sporolactobacillus shoreae]TGA97869.1 NAD(P)H-hydrate dehydratase [Sporolactobacillus shoreae]